MSVRWSRATSGVVEPGSVLGRGPLVVGEALDVQRGFLGSEVAVVGVDRVGDRRSFAGGEGPGAGVDDRQRPAVVVDVDAVIAVAVVSLWHGVGPPGADAGTGWSDGS